MGISNSSRRSFLSAPALAMAAFNLRVASGDDVGNIKLGIASYSVRHFPRAEAIRIIQRLGVKYVNIKSDHLPLESTPDQIRKARAEFEGAGLVIVGGGTISFLKDDEADMRSKFEYARLAHMPLIVCSPTKITLPKLEKFVREYDIRIAVHNHGPKSDFPAPQDALQILNNMDPRCGVCIDVGHTAQAGIDPVQAIRVSSARLFDMHIKDMRVFGDVNTQCDVGDGVLPIAGIFRELKNTGYSYCVNLEYEIDETDPFIGMARSYAYMKGLLRGLEHF